MELGEPKRRRVGEGAPGLCWSGDGGACEHNPQGWDPLWCRGTGLPGVEAGFPLEGGAELQVPKGWRGVMPWVWGHPAVLALGVGSADENCYIFVAGTGPGTGDGR